MESPQSIECVWVSFLPRTGKVHPHFLLLFGATSGFSVAALTQTVWNTLSLSICQSDQMLCLLTVCWRFMSQGASGLRGYHIMQMMALLSWVPSLKTRHVGAEWWVTGIQNTCTTQRTMVWWSWAEWAVILLNNMRDSLSFRIHRWPFEYHTSCLWVSRRWLPLMSLPSDRADGGVDARVVLKPSHKEGDMTVFLRLRVEWCFPSSLCGDCWSKILCSSIVNDSGDFSLWVLWGFKW